jgi:hypothetical protein
MDNFKDALDEILRKSENEHVRSFADIFTEPDKKIQDEAQSTPALPDSGESSASNDGLDFANPVTDDTGPPESESDVENSDDDKPTDLILQGFDQALYSLNEIMIYGTYGRTDACVAEAQRTIEILTDLRTRWEGQNKLIEILSDRA